MEIQEVIEQDPEEAMYHLYCGERAQTFNPNVFKVFEDGRVELGSFLVRAAIIGESHFVQLLRASDESCVFAEAIVCGGQAEEAGTPVILDRVMSGLDITYKFPSSAPVREIKVLTFHHSQRGDVPGMLGEEEPLIDIGYVFPGRHMTPTTRVMIEVGGLAPVLRISTAHEYEMGQGPVTLYSDTKLTLNMRG